MKPNVSLSSAILALNFNMIEEGKEYKHDVRTQKIKRTKPAG